MDDFFAAVGVPDGEVEGGRVDGFGVDRPAFGGVGEGLLQLDELGQIGVVEGVGLAEVAAGVKLVVPGFSGFAALFEEQHDSLDACTDERPAGTVENRVEIAAFQQEFAQGDRGIVGIGQEGVFDDDAGATAGF